MILNLVMIGGMHFGSRARITLLNPPALSFLVMRVWILSTTRCTRRWWVSKIPRHRGTGKRSFRRKISQSGTKSSMRPAVWSWWNLRTCGLRKEDRFRHRTCPWAGSDLDAGPDSMQRNRPENQRSCGSRLRKDSSGNKKSTSRCLLCAGAQDGTRTHTLANYPLKVACLPIPPPERSNGCVWYRSPLHL